MFICVHSLLVLIPSLLRLPVTSRVCSVYHTVTTTICPVTDSHVWISAATDRTSHPSRHLPAITLLHLHSPPHIPHRTSRLRCYSRPYVGIAATAHRYSFRLRTTHRVSRYTYAFVTRCLLRSACVTLRVCRLHSLYGLRSVPHTTFPFTVVTFFLRYDFTTPIHGFGCLLLRLPFTPTLFGYRSAYTSRSGVTFTRLRYVRYVGLHLRYRCYLDFWLRYYVCLLRSHRSCLRSPRSLRFYTRSRFSFTHVLPVTFR